MRRHSGTSANEAIQSPRPLVVSGPHPVSSTRAAAFARALLLGLAGIALVVATANSTGHAINWTLGPLHLTSRDPQRAWLAASGLGAILLALSWRVAWWRGAAITSLVVAAAIALLNRATDSGAPTGDAALLEIYTWHALRGRQVLGAYSQFGWHHPGPLSFYWLAPFFAIGKHTTFGLNTGVLVGNLTALAVVAWLVTVRAARPAVSYVLALAVMLALYLTRLPALLVNSWNPHTPVLPLVALLVTAAATLGGDRRLWPLALVLASRIANSRDWYRCSPSPARWPRCSRSTR